MKKKLPFFIALGVLVSGCAGRMPPLSEPLVVAPYPEWQMTDFKQLSRRIIATDRYTELQKYVAQVIARNADLKSLSATAKAASYNRKIARAEMGPSADLNLSGTRSKDAFKETGNTASVGIDVVWAVDVWGKLSDDAEAARHLANSSHYSLQQLNRMLIIQASRSWVTYRGYVHAEKYLNQLNMIETDLVNYYQDAYQAGLIPFSYYQGAFQVGLVPYEFLLDAKNSQKRSQSRLQEMRLKKLKTLQLMNILRGHLPSDELVIGDDGIPANLVRSTESIPATVLVNRPDIQAAFSELHAFRRSESAAYKALLPQINLTASASTTGSTLKKALSGDLVWQLIGGLTQPLFNSGQLRAIAEQKTAEAEASWWQYQSLVLKAMLEVENAMSSDKLLAWLLEQKQKELGNLVKKMRSAEERFSNGDLSFSDYLLIQKERIEAQIELNDLEVLYINNRFALIMALGLPLETVKENKDGEYSHESS